MLGNLQEFHKAIAAAVSTLTAAAVVGIQSGDWTTFVLALAGAAVSIYGVFKVRNKPA